MNGEVVRAEGGMGDARMGEQEQKGRQYTATREHVKVGWEVG